MSVDSMRDYNWPGPFRPYDHQLETAKFIVNNPRGFVLNEMGTGKSASLLWAADYLMSRGEVNKLLIIAPLSTLTRVWQDEAFRLLMHRRVVVLKGPAERRRKMYDWNWDIAVINFDGVQVIQDLLIRDTRSGVIDMVAIDEASAYRNSKTKRFAVAKSITDHVPRPVSYTHLTLPTIYSV